ncbi:MAG: FtsX-like permease family protein [Proteobacteria bacterium]|nr:FtsX-like permease family protein [Pseudomonadota bacterium]
MSEPAYELLRSARALAASGLVSGGGNRTVLIPGERPASERVFAVTASTLAVLGVRPTIGRWISLDADRVGGPAEVDLSYELWQRAFHGDGDVLGRTLRVSGKLYTVVGVMPRDFTFPARHPQLWVSMALKPAMLAAQNLTNFNCVMIGRLRHGMSLAQLDTGLSVLLPRIEQLMDPSDRAWMQHGGTYVASMPLRQFLGGTTRGRLLMMQLGAAALLLLAIGSLVNLALARALRRRDEAALRIVLGAGRPALFSQILFEALPLGAAATLSAWPLTELGMQALTGYGVASPSTPFSLHIGAALWGAATGIALALSSAALALPLLFVPVDRPAELLYGTGKGGGTGSRVRPLRLALSIGQIGLAIALLAGAALLGRSLRNMLDANPGYSGRQLYAATLLLQGSEYKNWGAWQAAHQRLAAAVAALPGVRGSGIGEGVPFSGGGSGSGFSPAQDRTPNGPTPLGAITIAGPGLMNTMGLRLLSGRLLDTSDAASNSTNVVIDERFADALFGRADVVGKTLNCALGDGTCRIVGVVGTIQDRFALHYAFAAGTAFVPEGPSAFQQWGGGVTTVLIRSSEPPDVLAREMRTLVQRTLPDQTLIAFSSMRSLISESTQGAAALASLVIAFGLLAFALAIIGTYGVVAYVTGLRRREFAIRQAVGADPGQIESLVLNQGLMLWAVGTLVGVGCALLFARSLAAELYRVSVFSPATYAWPAVVVGTAVMLASWIPARGASKLDLITQIRPQ